MTKINGHLTASLLFFSQHKYSNTNTLPQRCALGSVGTEGARVLEDKAVPATFFIRPMVAPFHRELTEILHRPTHGAIIIAASRLPLRVEADVQRGIDVFRGLNRCENEPPDGVVTYQRNTTTCRSFCGLSLPNVTLCSVEGGGHDWFGSPVCELVGGRPVGCEDIDSTGQAWAFFAAHQRQ